MQQSDLFDGCEVVPQVSDPFMVPSISLEYWCGSSRLRRFLCAAEDFTLLCSQFGLLVGKLLNDPSNTDLRTSKSIVIRFVDSQPLRFK